MEAKQKSYAPSGEAQSNAAQSIEIEKRPLAICPAASALNVVREAAPRLEIDANSDVAAL